MVERPRAFARIAVAGVLFQGGAAAVDTSTIVAALVGWLSGSPLAVGAAAAIARYGWLFPQLVVGWLAEGSARRMPYYVVGAYGRVVCLGLVAGLVARAPELPPAVAIAGFFVLWTGYAFVSGIVAVPYNDIVARAVPSGWRSRLLAVRFLGGGLLALAVAALAHRLLSTLPPADAYAGVLATGAVFLALSATSFVSAGEPALAAAPRGRGAFRAYLAGALRVWGEDARFRGFLRTQWLAGVAHMALPFYAGMALAAGLAPAQIALLLGAHTAGALASNPLWGWWGDRLGKRRLLEAAALANAAAPLLVLGWSLLAADRVPAPTAFGLAFLALGAAGNGGIIAQLGYLMEISPDDRRPSYSGYFNALAAPAGLLPLAGAGVASVAGFEGLLVIAVAAALAQHASARGLRALEPEGAPR